ncbi:NPCBM/NEW2 domain-containing protein [Kribbella sp.]|uniref:NPCBM/NEW2 domain-containing protein n=1 Tax=Kribbella sp. TaxID=1871183 RepID=UPI002D748B25|nr:NPCBM/NEW2 domain-containing protein [Kribbella sp.]HZX06403.1 NPCBM/NEW2 domain-containing protein [Kribbella sp.]
MPFRPWIAGTVGLLVALAQPSLVATAARPPLVTAAAAPSAGATTAVTLDGRQGGRTFDGIGAISGGGGNSRLLIDYPEPERSRILDYLFKPGYGANLQLLKVEIGGDTNSTDGAEPSHQHTASDLNCNRGYEWWLMSEAKKRNPAIKLYGLAWGAPGWIGGGQFWSHDMVEYLMRWLGCARGHGLGIDYLGGWNERGYDQAWYQDLHSTLAARGYRTQVVGADSGWDVADAMAADPKFNAAVDIIGAHYPCEGGDGGSALSCSSTDVARANGKPLWASENGSLDLDAGAGALIRSITRGYLDARMTAYVNWPLLAAIYPGMPYDTVGLAVADQPWSGAFRLGKSLWTTAQITQFTKPGWSFVDSASGYLGGDRANGSYVSLRAPDASAYSVIAETTTATAAQTFDLTVADLPRTVAHVWTTDVSSAGARDNLVHVADVVPDSSGRLSVTLQPGRVYTISTTSGQGAGRAVSPPRSGLPLPYVDSFEQYRPGAEARLLADMQGSYETVRCAGRAGTCLRQMTPARPIVWQDDSDAFALLGDPQWKDYTVATDTYWDQPGTVELIGRAGKQSRPQSHQEGYFLRIDDRGSWSIVRSSIDATLTTLAAGRTVAPGIHRWHRVALEMSGTTLTAVLDGKRIGAVDDATYATGNAGIGVVGYQTDQFDNLRITASQPAPPPTSTTVSAPAQLRRGESGAVVATFTVPADAPGVQGLDLTPGSSVPGWTFAPTAAHFDRVAPGTSVTATWQATAPTLRDTPAQNPLAVAATYTQRSVPHWSSGAGAVVDVPIPAPTGTAYVSDLAFVSTTNGWGPVERDTSNGEQAAGDGLPITLNGTVYPKGLGVHANGSVVVYLGGACHRFTATTGVDDEVDPFGTVRFTVSGDGSTLADTPVLTNASAPYPLDVDVTGVQYLTLAVGDAGDSNAHDHADWADAKLECN